MREKVAWAPGTPKVQRMAKPTPDLLRGIPLFAALTRPQLETIAAALTERDVPAGTTLVQEGTPLDEFHVLVKGVVEFRRRSRRGHDAPLETRRPGDWWGAIEGPAEATVTAAKDCTLLVMPRAAWEQLLFVNRDLAYTLLWSLVRRMAEHLRKARARIADLERRKTMRPED